MLQTRRVYLGDCGSAPRGDDLWFRKAGAGLYSNRKPRALYFSLVN
jgi:hypothetical protein